jgi:hypothetical protein
MRLVTETVSIRAFRTCVSAPGHVRYFSDSYQGHICSEGP